MPVCGRLTLKDKSTWLGRSEHLHFGECKVYRRNGVVVTVRTGLDTAGTFFQRDMDYYSSRVLLLVYYSLLDSFVSVLSGPSRASSLVTGRQWPGPLVELV
jgi:hypothetical protein